MVLSLAACSSEEVRQGSVADTVEALSPADAITSSEPAATAEQGTAELESVEPETAEAIASAPETSAPEASSVTGSQGADKGAPGIPGNSQPEPSEPETVEPETSELVIIVPETTEPETVESEESEPEETVNEVSDPVTLLNTTWALFGEDEKFPVTGGDFSSGELIQEAAWFSLEEPDSLDYVAGFPAAEIGSIDSAATLMHMMNQNTFTAGAYHVVDGTDMTSLSKAVRDNIMNRQWMCGFPDKLVVVNVGDYLVSVFGKNQPVDAFSAHLLAAYPTAVIVVDEPIL